LRGSPRGRRHGYDASSIREPAASFLYDRQASRRARDLHAIARAIACSPGLVLGYTPSGAVDFGLSRKDLAAATASPYGILVHASARPEKEWPEASWDRARPRVVRRAAVSLLLPWGGETEQRA